MSKNLRALTAIVLSQLLIECMGFFLGIPLSKILTALCFIFTGISLCCSTVLAISFV